MSCKYFLIIIILFGVSCKTLKENEGTGNEYFRIEVVQDGKVVRAKNGVILLKKKPFKYKLTLIKTDHVFVSNSWGTHYYDLPASQNIFQCDEESAEGINDVCYFVSVKTGSEDRFNVNKDIYVGGKSYHGVWFYDESFDWYRMDKELLKENGIVYSTVTVENIYDLDRRDEGTFTEAQYFYSVDQIQNDIYLVMATSHYEKGMTYPEELQRAKLILKFR